MVSGAMAGQALIAALSSQKTVKSTTNLTKTVKGLNKFQESGGLDELNNVMSNLQNSKPFLVPLKVIMAKLTSATAESTMLLIKDSLETIETEGFQKGIAAFAGILNFFLGQAGSFVTAFGNLTTGADETATAIEKLIFFFDNLAELNVGILLTGIAVALRDFFKIFEDLPKLSSDIDDWIPRWEVFTSNFKKFLDRLLGPLYDPIHDDRYDDYGEDYDNEITGLGR